MGSNNPTYKLSEVRNCMANDNYLIRKNAKRDAKKHFGWSQKEIVRAMLKLSGRHFYKTMPSENHPGIMLDVYKARMFGFDIYTHFYVHEGQLVIIDSFHEW